MTQSQNKGKSHPAAVILTFCIALWQMWHFGNQFQGSVALFIWRQSTLVPFQGIDGRTREDSNLLLWHACDSRLWITFFKEEKNLIKHCTSTYMSYRHGQYRFMAQCFQLLLQIFKFCTSFPHHFTEKKRKNNILMQTWLLKPKAYGYWKLLSKHLEWMHSLLFWNAIPWSFIDRQIHYKQQEI